MLSIDLWKTYLLYVKETKATLPAYKEKMAQAYDFALDRMGLDIQSHGIWSDYIKFLRGVDAQGNFAENQKITAIRKVEFQAERHDKLISLFSGLPEGGYQPDDEYRDIVEGIHVV